MWIGGTSTITIAKHRLKMDQPLPFPLDNNCFLFFSARYALFHSLSALGFKAGDTLLVPSYCCGSEIDPILAKGIKIQWYGIDENMRINIKELQNQWIKDVRGLLITHYLGFDQLTKEIFDFCHERKILVIEDCAHAFLSHTEHGEPLGCRGDAAVFSLRKTLPIPDGGALFLENGEPTAFDLNLKQPNPFAILFRVSELMGARLFFRIFYKLSDVGQGCLIQPNSPTFVSKAANWSISSFSRKHLQFQDWKGIVEKRRSNYAFLLEKIHGINGVEPLIPSLPAGISPLLFPTIVKDRHQLHKFLWKHGIDSHPWWGYFHPEVPWNRFPNAVKLKKELLGLPIHQDLDQAHMEEIIRVLTLATRTQ
jgi:perosamine synthetase